ncbi:MAG: epoxyqueuosine reductase, partial [Desulfobacterales bacterium]|nr:epoxyqueuosine reductase [Desulfobacterales bacterium]
GFEDIGFTTADPFDSHKEFLMTHKEEYEWAEAVGLELINGCDPKTILSDAKTIIILLQVYFKESFPIAMESHFGRCYLDDDRVTKDGLTQRIKAFRNFLRTNGIKSKVPFNLPHRVAAARAGMGTFGKNCLFYSSRVARQSSWNLPIAVILDHEFTPDEPTLRIACPDWCRNACISACPTRALKGNGTIDPRKCISFLSYFGSGITPKALREAMGMYIYGCDRCQNVCPRNAAWLAKELPMNQKVIAKAGDFNLSKLLHMDKLYFETKIWPHMFYMSYNDIWRWKMNVARVMGNSLDKCYTNDLIQGYHENEDEKVQGMIAWALGKIGDPKSKKALEDFSKNATGIVLEEISSALKMISMK